MGSSADDERGLRARVDGPFFNKVLKKWVGLGKLDYEVYLGTQALLALQTDREHLVVSEELMFQIVHQAQELWLKLLSFEMAEAAYDLDAGSLWRAQVRLERCLRVVQALENEIRVLETLRPEDFLQIRRNLGDGSGQESPGYNAVRVAAAGLSESFDRTLAQRELGLSDVYTRSGEHEELAVLSEALVDLDEGFQAWLVRHFFLVRRTIGVDRRVSALDGLPTRMLASRMTQPLFPALWDVRVEMTAQWKREGGFAPGAVRSAATQTRPPAGEPDE